MPRQTHRDFYNRLKQLEARVAPLLAKEQRALAALHSATAEPEKMVALAKYRRAVNATFKATDRRWKFLEKYQP
jgi:hypothetical protein